MFFHFGIKYFNGVERTPAKLEVQEATTEGSASQPQLDIAHDI